MQHTISINREKPQRESKHSDMQDDYKVVQKQCREMQNAQKRIQNQVKEMQNDG